MFPPASPFAPERSTPCTLPLAQSFTTWSDVGEEFNFVWRESNAFPRPGDGVTQSDTRIGDSVNIGDPYFTIYL